ncbi:MAG: serine hydrolase domain-containing protein, partial [Terriglobales bacterium]
MIHRLPRICALLSVFALAIGAAAQTATRPANPEIDQIADQVLQTTGVPSASIAVVKDGKLFYVNAYGKADFAKNEAATPSMRYSIGSISKQFTSSAILLLEQQGKLSINDKVAKFLPDLTRANEVTIRELLSHTSGYQDYWPQDYVMPTMLTPTTARQIVDEWAKKPLDFEPGTQWQYSNTNYVIAGLIIEKASGMPLVEFLRRE